MIKTACTIRGDHVCPTLLTVDSTAVGTTQDGKVIVVPVSDNAFGIDTYNLASTGDVAKTLHCSAATDTDHLPCVVSYGMSFDANFGFPLVKETAHTSKFGSSPGYKNGVFVCDS